MGTGRIDRYVPVLKGDTDSDRSEHELARLLGDLLKNPLVRAEIQIGTTLANGANQVGHGLGRKPRGFWAIAYAAGIVITDDRNTTDHTDRLLSVRASGATDATLVVF